MSRKNRSVDITDFTFAVCVLIAAWVLLFFKAPYRLEFKEQISIFFLGADRIDWYLSNPAVISSIIGDWLTQFYIRSWQGVTLSVLLLGVILNGLARFFHLSQTDKPVCLLMSAVPVLVEGYFITFPNYPVSATVGLALSVWTACALTHLKDSKISFLIYGLAVPVMFVIVGGHALTLALLLAFMKRKDGITPILFIAAGIAVMLICGKMYNLTLLQTLIWPVSPGYITPSNTMLLLMPWIVLVTMIAALFCGRFVVSRFKDAIFPVLFIFGIAISENIGNGAELERTVKIGSLAYKNDWDGVREMAVSKKSNFYRNYYWNLCNARDGLLADNLLKGGWGRSSDILFLETGKGNPYFSMMYYTDALLEMGDVSQATDCALLAQTIMPGHYSTRMLRRLAEIAVVTADYDVASKYLDILVLTRNHREWAQNLLDCIVSGDIPEQYLTWRSRTAPNDHFFVQGDIRSSLSIIASESPYNNIAIDYLLCSYLLDKNVNTFINLYEKYYLDALDRIVSVPDLYQEALLVNVTSQESLMETVEKYHISQRVVDKYLNIMEARAKSPQPANAFVEEMRGTYWHYIMAMRFNNTDRK